MNFLKQACFLVSAFLLVQVICVANIWGESELSSDSPYIKSTIFVTPFKRDSERQESGYSYLKDARVDIVAGSYHRCVAGAVKIQSVDGGNDFSKLVSVKSDEKVRIEVLIQKKFLFEPALLKGADSLSLSIPTDSGGACFPGRE